MKNILILLLFLPVIFGEGLFYEIKELPNGDSYFTISAWCGENSTICLNLIQKVKIILTNDTEKYNCGSEYGCANLNTRTAFVTTNHDEILFKVINHEIMHLYLWYTKGDYKHSDEFRRLLKIWNEVEQ